MPRRLWGLLREPRAQTAVAGIGWLVACGMGSAAIWAPPSSVSAEIGPWWTLTWAAFLLTGGVLGLVGCWILHEPWWRWVEQAGILSAAVGIAIYVFLIGWLQITSEGSRLVQICGITLGLLFILRRQLDLRVPARGWRREPAHGDR